MVYLAVDLDQLGLEVPTHFSEDGAEAVDGIGVKYLFPVFGHEDQMDVKFENTVSAVSNVT